MTEAITRLRNDVDQPVRIEDLARDLGMSVSVFHHHFKAVTALSPLQFQKQLRLQAVRRLMLGEGLDAASAGYRVGYRVNSGTELTQDRPFRAFGDRFAYGWYNMESCYHSQACSRTCSHALRACNCAMWH